MTSLQYLSNTDFDSDKKGKCQSLNKPTPPSPTYIIYIFRKTTISSSCAVVRGKVSL